MLSRLADGDTRSAVAGRLEISIGTVDFHLRNAYRKLGCHVAVRAVVVLLTWGTS